MSDEGDAGGGRRLFTRNTLLLAAVFVVGVAGSGIARRLLGEAGYNDLGVVVFVLGYAGMVFVVWFGWVRPLELTGPMDEPAPDRADRADGDAGDP
jgi:hypothetical protein